MRIVESIFNVPPLATPGGPLIPPCSCALLLVERWPVRDHRLHLHLSYPPNGRAKDLVIENPEPGMRLDLRGVDGSIPSVLIETWPPATPPCQSYTLALGIQDDIEGVIVTHHDHVQLLPLGVVRIANGAWGAHATFIAWRSGQVHFVFECSAEPNTFDMRLSGRMTGGMGENYYHSFGTQYRTSSPDTLRGYITPQPRVAAGVTHGGYVISGVPYRLEIRHGAAAPLDIRVDAVITPHTMMP